jgi:hypothetical protein
MGLAVLVIILVIVTVLACLAAYHLLDFGGTGVAVIALIGIIVTSVIGIGVWSVSYRNMHWATCHVTGKDRGGQEGSYRVYTDECDTLGNEDSMFQGKWNSSNVWQQIEVGKTYQFRIVGSRIPVFSQFANILEVKPTG